MPLDQTPEDGMHPALTEVRWWRIARSAEAPVFGFGSLASCERLLDQMNASETDARRHFFATPVEADWPPELNREPAVGAFNIDDELETRAGLR